MDYTETLAFSLREEIGNPKLFVGRQKELDLFLRWAQDTKMELSGSIAVLARRKKGKTSLLQRLYNLIYMQNDPQVIPFFFKIPETPTQYLDFSLDFYSSLIR